MLKRVVILGSTGSIGINALRVIERFPDEFRVEGLTAYHNVELLEEQIKKFKPAYVAIGNKGFNYLKKRINSRITKILDVHSQLEELVSLKHIDIVVVAMRGSAALKPFLAALRAGKRVAPANKEALVVAGDIIMDEAKKHNAEIIPIDSEQSAIFQCLEGQERKNLSKVYLTASGGPLLDVAKKDFDRLTVEDILRHPRWKMGKKITVDSATLMNKGFEVLEAKALFGLSVSEIEVIVHPQAIIHSMVEFRDGSIMAQLGVTDMRVPIQYALTYPKRLKAPTESLDFIKLKELTFRKPDYNKFPSLALAIEVAKRGGTLPSVLNAADEEAVEAFLNKKIKFSQIYKIVEKVVRKHRVIHSPKLNQIMEADGWAREEARKVIR